MSRHTKEQKKAYRARMVLEGKCSICAHRKATPSMKTCEPCRMISARSYAKASRSKISARIGIALPDPGVDQFCTDCQAHGFHRDGCLVVRIERRAA